MKGSKVLVILITVLAFVFSSVALALIGYNWRRISDIASLPSNASFVGGIPDGARLVAQDGLWVLAVDPRILAESNFPTNLKLDVGAGDVWDMDFVVRSELTLENIEVLVRVISLSASTIDVSLVSMDEAVPQLITETVNIPASPEPQEIILRRPAAGVPVDNRLLLAIEVVSGDDFVIDDVTVSNVL